MIFSMHIYLDFYGSRAWFSSLHLDLFERKTITDTSHIRKPIDRTLNRETQSGHSIDPGSDKETQSAHNWPQFACIAINDLGRFPSFIHCTDGPVAAKNTHALFVCRWFHQSTMDEIVAQSPVCIRREDSTVSEGFGLDDSIWWFSWSFDVLVEWYAVWSVDDSDRMGVFGEGWFHTTKHWIKTGREKKVFDCLWISVKGFVLIVKVLISLIVGEWILIV